MYMKGNSCRKEADLITSELNWDYWEHYFKFLNITRGQKHLQGPTLREETAGMAPHPLMGNLMPRLSSPWEMSTREHPNLEKYFIKVYLSQKFEDMARSKITMG